MRLGSMHSSIRNTINQDQIYQLSNDFTQCFMWNSQQIPDINFMSPVSAPGPSLLGIPFYPQSYYCNQIYGRESPLPCLPICQLFPLQRNRIPNSLDENLIRPLIGHSNNHYDHELNPQWKIRNPELIYPLNTLNYQDNMFESKDACPQNENKFMDPIEIYPSPHLRKEEKEKLKYNSIINKQWNSNGKRIVKKTNYKASIKKSAKSKIQNEEEKDFSNKGYQASNEQKPKDWGDIFLFINQKDEHSAYSKQGKEIPPSEQKDPLCLKNIEVNENKKLKRRKKRKLANKKYRINGKYVTKEEVSKVFNIPISPILRNTAFQEAIVRFPKYSITAVVNDLKLSNFDDLIFDIINEPESLFDEKLHKIDVRISRVDFTKKILFLNISVLSIRRLSETPKSDSIQEKNNLENETNIKKIIILTEDIQKEPDLNQIKII